MQDKILIVDSSEHRRILDQLKQVELDIEAAKVIPVQEVERQAEEGLRQFGAFLSFGALYAPEPVPTRNTGMKDFLDKKYKRSRR